MTIFIFVWTIWILCRKKKKKIKTLKGIKVFYVFPQELVKLVYLLAGFDQTETSFFRQVMNLQLQIALQLLHQFEGLHIFTLTGFQVSKAP